MSFFFRQKKEGTGRRLKKRWILLPIFIIVLVLLSIPELHHQNSGVSESIGTVRDGKLKNGWLMPFRGNNFHYFSYFSYYILNNAYVNHRVYSTLMEAYQVCETSCPNTEFVLMECTRKHGGRMIFHWTHQNGMSVDCMAPTITNGNPGSWSERTGLVHYLFSFNENGQFAFNKKTTIDFETMATHIIAIDDAAKKNGLRIRKILFNTSMHDELFGTRAGKILQERDLRFIPHLTDLVNDFHDDHYHIDFEIAD